MQLYLGTRHHVTSATKFLPVEGCLVLSHVTVCALGQGRGQCPGYPTQTCLWWYHCRGLPSVMDAPGQALPDTTLNLRLPWALVLTLDLTQSPLEEPDLVCQELVGQSDRSQMYTSFSTAFEFSFQGSEY